MGRHLPVAWALLGITAQVSGLAAQWEPARKLSTPTASLCSGTLFDPAIAVDGPATYVTWSLNMQPWSGANTLGCMNSVRSEDAGVGWSSPPIQWGSEVGFSLDLAASASRVHAAFIGGGAYSPQNYVSYVQSTGTAAGLNWSSPHLIAAQYGTKTAVSIASDADNVYLAWTEQAGTGSDLAFNVSTDGGSNWGQKVVVLQAPQGQNLVCPSLTAHGMTIDLVWRGAPAWGDPDGVFYSRSSNLGVNWSQPIRIDTPIPQTRGVTSCPTVRSSGSVILAAWEQDENGLIKSIFRRSRNGGTSWDAQLIIGNTPSNSWSPSLAFDGQNVHLVWVDDRAGDMQIFYKRSLDGGGTWSSEEQLTNATNSKWHPRVAVSGEVVHVVWLDYREGSNQVYYTRNPTGNNVPNAPIADLDIFDNREGLTQNVMWFTSPMVSWPPSPLVKKFALVNTSRQVNPDPDGPSQVVQLTGVHAIGLALQPRDQLWQKCLSNLTIDPSSNAVIAVPVRTTIWFPGSYPYWVLVVTPKSLTSGMITTGMVVTCQLGWLPRRTYGVHVDVVATGAPFSTTKDGFNVAISIQ